MRSPLSPRRSRTPSRRRQVAQKQGFQTAGKTRGLTWHAQQLFETEMDNFFSLFRRYLNDKAKGNEV